MTGKIIYKTMMIVLAAAAAAALAYFYPKTNTRYVSDSASEIEALVAQKVEGVSNSYREVTKVYYLGQLVGVLHDEKTLDRARQEAYSRYYSEDFGDMEISLNTDVYLYREKTNLRYEDADDRILDYLVENDMYLVEVYKISIGDKDSIYVKDVEDFKQALKTFVLNFVDEEVYLKLENNENILSLKTYGEQDVNVYIEEKMTCCEAKTNATSILKTQQDIINYLSYGRDYEMKYYTVQAFDTVPGVASKTGLTAEMIVTLNEDIKSVSQVLKEGTQLNVTPINSPLSVVVERERLVQETIDAPPTLYVNDDTLEEGTKVVMQDSMDGLKDTLYREIYVNGTLTSYMQVRTVITREPVQRVIHIAVGVPFEASGDFRNPTNNTKIICNYTCYEGHHGVDFTDRYHYYGNIYACGDGVITVNGFERTMGWHYFIDHGDGIVMRYMHMRSKGHLPVGTQVRKGDFLGVIGMTGLTTYPHVHISVYIKGVMVDPCNILPC